MYVHRRGYKVVNSYNTPGGCPVAGIRYWCPFKFYKHVNDDPDFAKTLLDLLFERYLGRAKK